MTDRWDALPGDAEAAPEPSRESAPSPDAAATAAPAPSSPAASSHFDHDAPTAKLPAVPKPRPKREPIKKPGPFGVIAGSAGLFFAVAALLAFQMRAGADPALGKGKPVVVTQATPAPREVLVRRVIVTRIVEHRPRRGAAATTAPRSTGSPPAAPAEPSAPAPSAPAPAPAAPLTTQSS